ncbi:MAG: hypothetical protein K6E30_02620 [Lachnospiraceae bacterium]|nr:hypothetical protein [Lachnospiraceae bacterium]
MKGRKMSGSRGIARIIVILLVLVLVLAVLILIPTVQYYVERSEEIACAAGMDTALRRVAENYIMNNGEQTADDAKEAVAAAMGGWDDLCPAGGKVYLVETDDGAYPYTLVCGMHDKDKKLCTRLNSGYVLEQLKEGLSESQKDGEPWPAELTFSLNGKEWTAYLTDEESGLKRGTATTKGLEKKGIVAYYGLAGHSGFKEGSSAKEGEICYFSFADESHCANWEPDDGWTGDSYNYLK